MSRFTLYRGESASVADASELIRSLGARIIVSKPGLALIESSDEVVEKLRSTLQGWKIAREVTAKVPNPRPKMP